MKYIKKEHIITTICDENIDDVDIIKSLLENLNHKRIYFSICYCKKKYNGIDDHLMNYKNIRIRKVKDNSIDITVYNYSSHININDIFFDDIEKISVITKKQKLLNKNTKNKFSTLDLGEQK